jgi:ABC-type multidrug transport system permease subunit
MWGDRITFLTKLLCTIVQALINGSLFYNLSDSSDSIFLRPGALFFGILYFAMESLAETTNSFRGRPILQRHDDFAFYRPTASAIALVITDIPIALVNVSFFSIVYYWMVGFQADAGKFFLWWVIILVNILCMVSFFRMVGALCRHFGRASFVSGCMNTVFMIYTGVFVLTFSADNHGGS